MAGAGMSSSAKGPPYACNLIAFIVGSSALLKVAFQSSGGFAVGAKADHFETANVLRGGWGFTDEPQNGLGLLTNARQDRRRGLFCDCDYARRRVVRRHAASLHLVEIVGEGAEG